MNAGEDPRSGAGSKHRWLAAAPPALLTAWLAGVALATTSARYSPGDLALLIASYASLAAALHFGTAPLLRGPRPAAAIGALAIAVALVWHLREQAQLPAGRGWFVASALLAACVWYALARAAAARRGPGRPVVACLASAAVLGLLLAGGFFASPSFRWHLLRHNKLLGASAYYALAGSVDASCDALWSARSVPDVQPVPEPDGPAVGPPPNLVLVLVDTLRADALAAYGGRSGDMPRLDALVERAAVFTDVLANSSWTRPSVASLFTGLRPEEHGANEGSRLSEAQLTLAERLRTEGYETVALVSNFANVGRDAGFAQGFERFDELEGDPLPYARADRVTDAAVRFLEERARAGGTQRPLFLYVHYLDPHEPYLSGVGSGPWPWAHRQAYAAELRFLDPQLERLVTALEASLSTQPFVLVTSDHGEEFGEHGEGGHGHSLYGELVRIPALLVGPGVEPQRIGARLEGRDLFHLLRELARGSAPDPAAWARDRHRDRRFTSTYARMHAAARQPFMRRICMRGVEEDGYFLIWSAFGPSLELYRREDDPGETRNLIRSDGERVGFLMRVLDTEPGAWVTAVPLESRDETEDLLRRLGYAE